MKKHIVVIDNDNLILTLTKDFLQAPGFQVSTSDNGIFSNHIIYNSNPPDLIIIDLMMPLINGDHKIKTLKSTERSRNSPVLLMSSKMPAELLRRENAAGAEESGALTARWSWKLCKKLYLKLKKPAPS